MKINLTFDIDNNQELTVNNNQTLIIFTRYPEIGKTKTRLIPLLGEKGAAELQRKMTEETLKKARNLQAKIPFNIEVHFTGGNEELMQKWLGKDLIIKQQIQGDLGEKMLNSLTQVFSQKNQQAVIIIGIDCPDLDEIILKEAFEACQKYSVVLGEAEDGGYYLIGLNQVIPQLFNKIKWGSNEVFKTTKNRAEKLQLTIYNLPVLNDIDRPEDVKVLSQ